jgi:hypothetical protein
MKDVAVKTYKKKPQAALNVFASTVQQLMFTDPQFATLMDNIKALKVDNDAFTVAIANALRGSDAQKDARNDAYKVVIDRLDSLAYGVNGIANGDERVARAAGFDTPAERTSIKELPIPTGLEASDNKEQTGSAKVKYDKAKGVVSTGVEYQKMGETAWQNGTFSTGSSAMLTGLDAGAYYNVRVYYIGRKELKSDPSDYVTVLVS